MRFNFKDKNEYIRIIKFGFVGVFNTLIDWAIFFVLTTFLSFSASLSHIISYSCGTVFSYVGNKFFTFKSKSKVTLVETAKFVAVNLISLAVSTAVIFVFADKLGWNELMAKIPATVAAMAVNFLGNRFFVFNKEIENK